MNFIISPVSAEKPFVACLNISSQLAKENKKFLYGVVKKGSRAKDYEDAIQ